MRAPRAVLLVVAPALLAGCTWGTPPGPGDRDAPWWEPGTWWEVRLTGSGDEGAGSGGGSRSGTLRAVVFGNESEHFHVGIDDRALALDLADRRSAPFLGLVHAGSLALHEDGAHAAMWRFPLTHGETFQSRAFGHAWDLRVEQRADGFHVLGTSADGATAEWDWDPGVRWFRHLRVTGADGEDELSAEVVVYGSGATGTYRFGEAREAHRGPSGPGVHEERFNVTYVGREAHWLALGLDVEVGGPARLELVDPRGSVRHAESTTGGRIDRVEHVLAPPEGTWTLRYLTNATVDGSIRAWTVAVYEGTV